MILWLILKRLVSIHINSILCTWCVLLIAAHTLRYWFTHRNVQLHVCTHCDKFVFIAESFYKHMHCTLYSTSLALLPLHKGGRVWWHSNMWACNRGLQWGGVTCVGMLAPTCWRSWLFYLCMLVAMNLRRKRSWCFTHSVEKQQVPFICSLFAIICAVIMVIKECKALIMYECWSHVC